MKRLGPAKQLFFSAAAFVAGLAVCLAFLEVFVRIVDLMPGAERGGYADFAADPHLPYKPRPESVRSGHSASGEFDFHYRHDAFGLREGERETHMGGGRFTLLVLGDSFTYGVGARFEETYPSRLETMLNDRSGALPVEVVNAGIPGYFPEAERMFLEHYGKRWSPDLVLVGVLPNDVYDTALGVDAFRHHESGYLLSAEAAEAGQFVILLGRHSRLFRTAFRAWIALRRLGENPPRWREIFKEDGLHERDWRKVENEFRKMISICRERGSRIVFIHIPQKGPWKAMHAYPAKRLAAFANENGAGFIDVLPAMRRAAESEQLYYEKDGHCTPAGYRVIAREVFRRLTENGLVPGGNGGG
jgi:lysophospholipase L1-like esterase